MLEVLCTLRVSLTSNRHKPYVFRRPNMPGVLIAVSYLNIKVLVDLDNIAKEEDVLHQTGKLPHIPQVLQCLGGLRGHLWLGRNIELGLFRRALEARHCEKRVVGVANSGCVRRWPWC
jgi:hypothetical protein